MKNEYKKLLELEKNIAWCEYELNYAGDIDFEIYENLLTCLEEYEKEYNIMLNQIFKNKPRIEEDPFYEYK